MDIDTLRKVDVLLDIILKAHDVGPNAQKWAVMAGEELAKLEVEVASTLPAAPTPAPASPHLTFGAPLHG